MGIGLALGVGEGGSRQGVRLGDSGAHDVLAEAVDRALAAIGHEAHLAALARLEAHGGAGRDVEAHAARLRARSNEQRRIGLEEMVVAADLDRPVAGVGDDRG